MITAYICGQDLRVYTPTVASNTINYITLKAEFDESWAVCEHKFVTFKQGTTIYQQELNADGEITADMGLDLPKGAWEISFVGTTFDGTETAVRATTIVKTIYVERSGVTSGEPFPTATGSAGEQILAQADAAKQAAEEAADRAEEALAELRAALEALPSGVIE